ncbi:hypothetical protein SAMN05216273_11478 [Chryseobacterium taihuense]|uniref:Uncharacterized protein n=1 Tax=Chryseobacterium taihuense TaxID=1141221 RepID=A0ABY0QZ38_9FLAO|nr:hypothetical protein SAMN05216273_11478 [Chryseobacterium taihuense]
MNKLSGAFNILNTLFILKQFYSDKNKTYL